MSQLQARDQQTVQTASSLDPSRVAGSGDTHPAALKDERAEQDPGAHRQVARERAKWSRLRPGGAHPSLGVREGVC